jgi:isopenicillin N synthase-like dioxygenase
METNTDHTNPEASVVTTEMLPVIDLGPLNSEDSAARASIVDQLRYACLRHGFFYLTNHGIAPSLMEQVVTQARRFFALDEHTKRQVAQSRSSGHGYGRMGGKAIDGNFGAHVKEEFYYSRDVVPGMHDHNRWPAARPGFREPLETYLEDLHRLAQTLMGLLAETLDLPADHFAAFCREPLANVRLARYPPEGAEAGAHSDFGALTFLLQDTMPGLQVFDRVTGGWIHAPPIKGSFIVNLGDLFEVFTNGTYPSTPHRVIHPAGEERISVPFFYTGAHDYVVSCLPGFAKKGEAARFAPITPAGHLVTGHEAQGF